MLADHCLHNENAVSIPKEDLNPYLYLLDHLSHRLEPKIRLVCRSLVIFTLHLALSSPYLRTRLSFPFTAAVS